MNKMTLEKIMALLVVVLCFCVGCGGPKKPPGLPMLHPTLITVTQGGAPLEGATVILFPKTGGSSGWNTIGLTDAKGVAEMKTAVNFKGAPVGEYVVRVSKNELSPSAVPDTPPSDPVEFAHWRDTRAYEVRTTIRYVKAEFDDVKKTPHSITISEGKNEATFDVGEPIKEELK